MKRRHEEEEDLLNRYTVTRLLVSSLRGPALRLSKKKLTTRSRAKGGQELGLFFFVSTAFGNVIRGTAV